MPVSNSSLVVPWDGQRPAGWQQKTMSYLRKDVPGGIDSAQKGLVYAAAQENEFALEGADGGLFITRLLQQVGQASDTSLAELFAQTQRLVPQDSGGQQNPVAVGDTTLGQNLKLTKSR